MSKLLKRALKISLTPAILMIVGKFLGILIPTLIYDFEFVVQNEMMGISSVQILFPDTATTPVSYTHLDVYKRQSNWFCF